MKKYLLLALLTSFSLHAQTLETHINDSVKPLGKMLEGKRGKVVLGTFKSAKATDTCAPSKAVNSKINAALARAGVKTTLSTRAVGMDADQAEISRVTKLSGGSYIVLGTYELSGTKFKLDCAVYDHNGASIGACEEVTAATLSQEVADSINCPKEEKPAVETPKTEASKAEVEGGDLQVKKIDDYICSIIHKEYDLKRLVTNLYEKKYYSLEDLKGVRKNTVEDALDVRKEYCVTLGNFVVCTDYWDGSGAQVFLGDTTALGATKILSWKHPNKSQVKDAARCLKKDDNWWNP
ncbi:hypothetical protein C0V70_15860 [Bacteriovorax stolpii]|uniref:Uncharacterized protein n=1 Tax=Bacteriovorax stolpii TaxID=960 RepID=A0A2K9NVK6_BACTC|nr:hypothetical protein [Bacteriovorax stolpii]AUN99553.1 hypothetical protein C0V70_15860 [Bacteriovorax stolpii]TDP51182.1 hypothetical protein C8D79_3353 [Bacteriovorax stolpii]